MPILLIFNVALFAQNEDDDDVELLLEGSGDIAGENIQHPNGNVFD